ncbi:MAG: hypothetical protein V4773_03320 [Verrucomicrobiota bacterium]
MLQKRLLLLLVVASFALLAIAATRRYLSIREVAQIAPGTTQSTGCEEESFYAVWRAARGQEVYADTARLPFASAYFNWAFYRSYGAFVRPIIEQHGDAALPFAGRLLTLIGAVAGALVAGLLCAALLREQPGEIRWLGIALGAAAFLGPITSWWIVTVRPDIWAYALEACAVALLLWQYRTRPKLSVFLATLLFFASWSFKHNYVAGLGAALVFLLVRKDWLGAALMTIVSIALWGTTIATMGASYWESIRSSTHADFSLGNGLGIGKQALMKSLPVLVALPLVLRTLFLRRHTTSPRTLAGDALLLGAIGLALSTLLTFPSTCKIGAASNYYFTVFFIACLAVCAALALNRATYTPLLVALGLATVLVAPLTGKFGTLSLRPSALDLAERWRAWQQQPEPRYSFDLRLNVPWLVRTSPPIVLAYNYDWDRRHQRTFESGGIGGLIEQGYFASLFLPADTTTHHDGGSLKRYTRVSDISQLTLYRRTDLPPPSAP